MKLFEIRNTFELFVALIEYFLDAKSTKIVIVNNGCISSRIISSVQHYLHGSTFCYEIQSTFDKINYYLKGYKAVAKKTNNINDSGAVVVFHDSSPFVSFYSKKGVPVYLYEHGLVNYKENHEALEESPYYSKILSRLISRKKMCGRRREVKKVFLRRPEIGPKDLEYKTFKLDLAKKWGALNQVNRDKIKDIFDYDEVPFVVDKKNIVLATQPFSEAGRITESQKIAFYAHYIELYGGQGDVQLWLKPHPSETTPYDEIFKKVRIIPSQPPLEIIAYSSSQPLMILSVYSSFFLDESKRHSFRFLTGQIFEKLPLFHQAKNILHKDKDVTDQ